MIETGVILSLIGAAIVITSRCQSDWSASVARLWCSVAGLAAMVIWIAFKLNMTLLGILAASALVIAVPVIACLLLRWIWRPLRNGSGLRAWSLPLGAFLVGSGGGCICLHIYSGMI